LTAFFGLTRRYQEISKKQKSATICTENITQSGNRDTGSGQPLKPLKRNANYQKQRKEQRRGLIPSNKRNRMKKP
jgi:hypothetical protein